MATSTNVEIGELSIGINSGEGGMSAYKESLRIALLDDVKTKLNESYENIMGVINTGWQGASRDKFDEQLYNMMGTEGTIAQDLTAEYADLEARLSELEAYYYEQDRVMAEEN